MQNLLVQEPKEIEDWTVDIDQVSLVVQDPNDVANLDWNHSQERAEALDLFIRSPRSGWFEAWHVDQIKFTSLGHLE